MSATVEEIRLLLRIEQSQPMCACCDAEQVPLVGDYCDDCKTTLVDRVSKYVDGVLEEEEREITLWRGRS